MSEFKAGDKVLVGGSIVAEIVTYDVDSDVLRFITGETNTHTTHISNTRVEPLTPSLHEDLAAQVDLAKELNVTVANPVPETLEEGLERTNNPKAANLAKARAAKAAKKAADEQAAAEAAAAVADASTPVLTGDADE